MMQKPLIECPSCHGELHISALCCPDCGMELKSSFELSMFDKLSPDLNSFLLSFLRCRGNLKCVQNELQISYPTAKKKLDDLLFSLNLTEPDESKLMEWEKPDMSNWLFDSNSTEASEIIRSKLIANGGRAVVHTASGLPCEIRMTADGMSFSSDKLPANINFRFGIFDIVVDLLIANNGRARKGNGRNHKLGEPDCDETTVVGYIGKHYFGKKDGESVLDPVFVLASVLEWAEIANNGRGEISLTTSYRAML